MAVAKKERPKTRCFCFKTSGKDQEKHTGGIPFQAIWFLVGAGECRRTLSSRFWFSICTIVVRKKVNPLGSPQDAKGALDSAEGAALLQKLGDLQAGVAVKQRSDVEAQLGHAFFDVAWGWPTVIVLAQDSSYGVKHLVGSIVFHSAILLQTNTDFCIFWGLQFLNAHPFFFVLVAKFTGYNHLCFCLVVKQDLEGVLLLLPLQRKVYFRGCSLPYSLLFTRPCPFFF